MASHTAYLPFVSSPVARKRYTSPTTATVRPWAGLRITGFEGLLIGSYSSKESRLVTGTAAPLAMPSAFAPARPHWVHTRLPAPAPLPVRRATPLLTRRRRR